MGDIVNLRRARKAKVRLEAASRAAAQRRKFGATLAERQTSERELALERRRLDGHRRDVPAADGAKLEACPDGRGTNAG